MILLVTNERDITTDYIVLELQRRGIDYFRLNSERFSDSRIRYRPELGANGWRLSFGDKTFSVADITAAYFRRPGAPLATNSVVDAGERRYCEQEWTSLLRSLYTAVSNRWLNEPTKIALAEDKPRQLAVAVSLGFKIPETLITNDAAAATAFIEAKRTIAKTLHTALLEAPESERVIFTSRLAPDLDISPRSLAAAPIILQREITKKFDVRATVVGNKVFAATIASQQHPETSVDWRRGDHVELAHKQHTLPQEINEQCVALVKALGLRFAAIDFILDTNNTYWFLEANPNGQWAWIENRTGHTIAAAIVDELLAATVIPSKASIHPVRRFLDFFWPTLEARSSDEQYEIDEKTEKDIEAARLGAWLNAPEVAIEEARRLSEAEDERFRTTESKASTYILFAGALVPILTYLESTIWDAKFGNAPKWLAVLILLASVLYLTRAGIWAFRAVQVGTFHRLDVQDLLRVWQSDDPKRLLIREMLACTRRNQEPVNTKVSSITMAHAFMKRAFIVFGILLVLEAGWELLSALTNIIPNSQAVAAPPNDARISFIPSTVSLDGKFSMDVLLCNPSPSDLWITGEFCSCAASSAHCMQSFGTLRSQRESRATK